MHDLQAWLERQQPRTMEQRRNVVHVHKRRLLSSVTPAVIELDGVSRHFDTGAETIRAVDEVTFSAGAGEFVCLFGASGSGKSTLLKLIAGLDAADRGTIKVGDYDVSASTRDARARMRLSTVGVIFQQDNLIEEFTVAENVAFPLELMGGLTRSQITAESESWLERVGMQGFARRFPRELSGGQQQRVGVARALVGERRVLIADEPTGALDSTNSAILFELLHELSRAGKTVLLSSHDKAARSWGSRIVEMVDGRLLGG